MNHSTTGVEPSAAALELIALVLACRDSAPSETRVELDESQFMPPHLDAISREALSLGSLIALFETPASDPEHTVLFHSVQREINLRNPVYPEMLLDTLLGLFSDPAVDDDCRAALGFSGQEAVNVMAAVRALAVSELEQRFSHMDAARDASLPYLKARRTAGSDASGQPEPAMIAAMQEVFDALQGLTTNIAEATIIDRRAVSTRTGYEDTVVGAILDAFTLTESLEVTETLERFFRGDNPLRTAPIVSDSQGRLMLVHDGLALPAVREVIETRLTGVGHRNAYDQHRGRWVENAAIDLLESALPGGEIHRSFNYFVPDPRAAAPQVEPDEFTKRVECDGLILIDDIALIIEVKSVALTAEARGGVARRLRGKLRDIITDAANQAGRLRERIIADQWIRLEDDQRIDVSSVREIHTVAVGLEDLSGVTTATPALIASGVLKPDNVPWTVSLHDLRVVCELLDRPSELVLYLRRRTQPETTWKYRAVDELDLFLLFLSGGLYYEPDPQQLATALPWSTPPSTGDMRRYQKQHPQLVEIQTQPLDDWYASQLDPVDHPAGKPKFVGDQKLLDLVDMTSSGGQPGWLSTSTNLLEGSGRVQKMFGRYAADLAKLVQQDRQHHSMTHLMGDIFGKHTLLVWACHGPDEGPEAAAAYLTPYLQAKKRQTRAHRAACMLFDPKGRQLQQLLYDNTPLPDTDLEEPIAGLVPLDQMKRKPTRPGSSRKTRR